MGDGVEMLRTEEGSTDAVISKILVFVRNPVVILIALGLGIRLVIAPFLTFDLDTHYWVQALALVDNDEGLYGSLGYFYTPVWGYVMSVMAGIGTLLGVTDYATLIPDVIGMVTGEFPVAPEITSPAFNVLMKIPIILADIACALLIRQIVIELIGDGRKATVAMALWLLCPLAIVESTMHVMFDSISAMMLLLAVLLAVRRRYFLAGASLSLGVLTKFFPMFFVFVLAAYVLRREGMGSNGFRRLLHAVCGAVAALVLLEIPAALSGQLSRSVFFIAERVGLSEEFLDSVLTVRSLVILMAVVAVVYAAYRLLRSRSSFRPLEAFASMGPDVRERKVRRTLLAVAVLAAVTVLVYSVMSVSLTGGTMDVFTAVGMKLVTILSIISLLGEVYVAYRLLFCGRFDGAAVLSALAASSVLIFLWPPAASYTIIMVPFLLMYSVAVDRRFLPLSLLVIGLFALAELPSALTSLSSIAVYWGFPSVGTAVVGAIGFLTGTVAGFPVGGLIMAVPDTLAYVLMLYLLLRWFRSGQLEAGS